MPIEQNQKTDSAKELLSDPAGPANNSLVHEAIGRPQSAGVESITAAKHFMSAVVREAIQRPANGTIELASEVTGHRLPQLHIVSDKIIHGDTFDTAGGLTGRALDYLLVDRLTHGKLSSGEMTTSQMFKNNFVYGAIDGGIFTPTHATGKNFLFERSSNALASGLSYGIGSTLGVRGAEKLGQKFPSVDAFEGASTWAMLGSSAANSVMRAREPREGGALSAKILEAETLPSAAVKQTQEKPDAVSAAPKSTPIPETVTAPETITSINAVTAPEAVSAPASISSAPERTDLDGKFDQSALAKRVTQMIEHSSLDPNHSVWVAQHGKEIVLEGKIKGQDELKKLIQATQHYNLVANVNVEQMKVV